MYMSVIEARDYRFAFTVYESGMGFKEIEVAIGANMDYLRTPHRHQPRIAPPGVHRQYVGIIEDEVCR